MKTKYERMSKDEQKELYVKYKKEKPELARKLERMLLFSKVGIGLAIFVFIYDVLIKQGLVNYCIDIFLFVFFILTLIKLNSTKKNLLNEFVLNTGKSKNKKKD